MSEKVLLKALTILENSQKEMGRERDYYIRTIKDLTDKIYFMQSKNEYMVSKNMDAVAEERRTDKKVKSSSDDFEEGQPLSELSEEKLGEVLRHG